MKKVVIRTLATFIILVLPFFIIPDEYIYVKGHLECVNHYTGTFTIIADVAIGVISVFALFGLFMFYSFMEAERN